MMSAQETTEDVPEVLHRPQRAIRTLYNAVRLLEDMVEDPDVAGDDSLSRQWEGLMPNLRALNNTSNRPTHIAVWGETGVGKSTLLNTVLGEDILPADGGHLSTTSKAVELAYKKGDDYEVKVYLLTREKWLEHRVQVARAWKEAPENDYDEQQSNQQYFQPLLPEDIDIARFSDLPIEWQEGLPNPSAWPEPREFLALLDKRDHIERIKCETADHVSEALSKYASNSMESLAVERVVVRGNFEILSGGMRLVDLPGTGDSNRLRTRAAKDYMQTCSNVWLVVKANRAAADPDFSRAIRDRVEDRMLPNCAIIVTRADELYRPKKKEPENVQATRRKEKVESCKKDLEKHVSRAIESCKDTTLPVPPIFMTSCPPNGDPQGIEELHAAIGSYQKRIFSNVVTLHKTVTETFDRMSEDVERLRVNPNYIHYQPPDSKARSPIDEKSKRLVRQLCERFEREMHLQLTMFVDNLESTTKALGHSLGVEMRKYLTHMSWQSMRAILMRYGGPHRAYRTNDATGRPENVEYDANIKAFEIVAGADAITQWQQALDRVAAIAQRFENEALTTINEALQFARAHPYFGTVSENGAAYLQPIRNIRDELPGKTLAFHDQYLPTEIERARRGFRDRIRAGVQTVARENKIYYHAPGENFAMNAPTAVAAKFEENKDKIVEAVLREVKGAAGLIQHDDSPGECERVLDGFLRRTAPRLRSHGEKHKQARVSHEDTLLGIIARKLALAEAWRARDHRGVRPVKGENVEARADKIVLAFGRLRTEMRPILDEITRLKLKANNSKQADLQCEICNEEFDEITRQKCVIRVCECRPEASDHVSIGCFCPESKPHSFPMCRQCIDEAATIGCHYCKKPLNKWTKNWTVAELAKKYSRKRPRLGL